MSFATDWKETVPEGEAARLEELAAQLRELQRKNAHGGAPSRALHAKGNGVRGQFEVLGELPEAARVGLFAAPARFGAYVRFSNGMGRRGPDRRGDVRGIAVKLLGVPGKKLIPGMEDARTQDFLCIHSAATPFRDAEEFVWFVRAAARPALLLPRALWHFGPRRALQIIGRIVRQVRRPVTSLATTPFFSALPIQFGRAAAKYELSPQAAPDPAARPGKSNDYLAEELAARLARGPVAYDFRVRFFVDEARTPIEDASREWDAPPHTIARLTLPQQDVASAEGKQLAEMIETLSFDPWHAGVDFRPLGNMMRARNAAYRLSTQERGAAPEPDQT